MSCTSSDWHTNNVEFVDALNQAPNGQSYYNWFNNNATKVISTTPYVGPGVVTKRVDENVYEWMNEATKGNLIRASGYKF